METFFPVLFGGEEINANLRKFLGCSVKHGGLCIPDPRFSAENVYNTSNPDRKELVGSLLGGTALNYVVHRAYVGGAIAGQRKRRSTWRWQSWIDETSW